MFPKFLRYFAKNGEIHLKQNLIIAVTKCIFLTAFYENNNNDNNNNNNDNNNNKPNS